MRYYDNHIVVLEAIEAARQELTSCDLSSVHGETYIAIHKLQNMYACLNIAELKQIVIDLKALNRRKEVRRHKRAA